MDCGTITIQVWADAVDLKPGRPRPGKWIGSHRRPARSERRYKGKDKSADVHAFEFRIPEKEPDPQ